MPLTSEQLSILSEAREALDTAGTKLEALVDDAAAGASSERETVNDALDMVGTVREMLAALDGAGTRGPSEPGGKPDWQVYLDRYDDVRAGGPYTEAWARRHFETWGRDESRVWGKVKSEPRRRFHHYNASAWHDRGVAVILCPGERAESARIGGRRLRRHGSLDKGREVWADYHRRGLTGTLELVIGGVSYTTEITDADGMTEGDCWSHG